MFENLRCTKEGLSSEDVNRRLEIFGQNKLEEKKVMLFEFFCFFVFVFPFSEISVSDYSFV